MMSRDDLWFVVRCKTSVLQVSVLRTEGPQVSSCHYSFVNIMSCSSFRTWTLVCPRGGRVGEVAPLPSIFSLSPPNSTLKGFLHLENLKKIVIKNVCRRVSSSLTLELPIHFEIVHIYLLP